MSIKLSAYKKCDKSHRLVLQGCADFLPLCSVNDMELTKVLLLFHFSDVCMIGDDIRDDVLGAQNAGFQVNFTE